VVSANAADEINWLVHATPEGRKRWRLIGSGTGIHWEDIDEDVSIEGLLLGKPSRESQQSFDRWLVGRQAALTG
jgi:hypothetical protein